jgi:hypothetical protein
MMSSAGSPTWSTVADPARGQPHPGGCVQRQAALVGVMAIDHSLDEAAGYARRMLPEVVHRN